MRMTHARAAITAFAIGAFTTGAALFGTGIATADLIDDTQPLLTSTCSFSQIDAALHDVAPESAKRLDAAPVYKSMLQMALTQPADLRLKAFQQLEGQKKLMDGLMPDVDAAKPELGPALRGAAAMCHEYPKPGSAMQDR
ncbi:hemophore-related protein [Nocardia pseudobrasiliensis]|uniref:Hemophore-related protein n=1 Tax=Nocardia pseudobrasiliensis TaxID=45979 RepID=A0A370HSS6_9NOCA|nr:hemophore-related protein [Nocardia pseudobrasiliensis]RDI61566.1 hemophore-related protein [Nocardia pseudobrasiliensis]